MTMKTRRFYPLSTIKRLDGRDPSSLSAGEKAALLFALRRVSRAKIAVVGAATENTEANVSTPEEFEATKAKSSAKIRIKL
jgi:hypothetical protein